MPSWLSNSEGFVERDDWNDVGPRLTSRRVSPFPARGCWEWCWSKDSLIDLTPVESPTKRDVMAVMVP